MLRFLAILIALITFIYLYIPRVDFFLSILIFLGFFMSVFTFDEPSLFKRLTVLYTLISVFFFLLFLSGLGGLLIKAFTYGTDVLVLIAFIGMMLFIRKSIRSFPDGKRNYRNILILSIVTPLVLCPLFKYGLRVPLPKEGGIIGLMNLIWYRIF